MEFRPRFLLRLLGLGGPDRVWTVGRFLLTMSGRELRRHSLGAINALTITRGFWSCQVSFSAPSGTRCVFGGLSQETALALKGAIEAGQTRFASLRTDIAAAEQGCKKLNEWLESASSATRWVAHSDLASALDQAQSTLKPFRWDDKEERPAELADLWRLVDQWDLIAADPESCRKSWNGEFEAAELGRYAEFFDSCLQLPLSEQQRRAVVVDEDAELVVAAAGSGKTTMLKAKVAYLVDRGLAAPGDITLISFNARVRQELIDALEDEYPGIAIHTFHSLGLSLSAQARGKMPSLSTLAEDRQKLGEFIHEALGAILENNADLLRDFFILYLRPYRDVFSFKTKSEYCDYVKSIAPVTLQGERVRSLEELEIANFLYSNGVHYRYEAPYEIDLASIDRRQYKPDFYLPDYGIYIEHFALNEEGETPPFIDGRKYRSEREWKLETHDEYDTTLVETFSFEKRQGKLCANLEKKLQDLGVEFDPVPDEELFNQLNKQGYVSQLAQLVGTFLNLYKGSLAARETLDQRAEEIAGDDLPRARCFLALFDEIFSRYEAELSGAKEIDFNDMIGEASAALERGVVAFGSRYVLVDEFQDISVGRARFLGALRVANPAIKLVAVGDDWQSIYRFAGSDIGVMTGFEGFFGPTETRFLAETFRFDQRIEAVASTFVLKNPAQIRKSVVARPPDQSSPAVVMWVPRFKERPYLSQIADLIEEEWKSSPGSSKRRPVVLLLGRYRYLGDESGLQGLREEHPALNWEFKTVHAAKGADVDYAVILSMKSGFYAFPSEIVDDPLLDLVLSGKDHFEHAEERRLFYVALTRARRRVFVVGHPEGCSSFFYELLDDSYYVDKTQPGPAIQRRCPECSALMVERNGRSGLFFGCSNFPVCNETANPCPRCRVGYLVKSAKHASCDNAECKARFEICPECAEGLLVEKEGRYGRFIGCTNWSKTECDYTRRCR